MLHKLFSSIFPLSFPLHCWIRNYFFPRRESGSWWGVAPRRHYESFDSRKSGCAHATCDRGKGDPGFWVEHGDALNLMGETTQYFALCLPQPPHLALPDQGNCATLLKLELASPTNRAMFYPMRLLKNIIGYTRGNSTFFVWRVVGYRNSRASIFEPVMFHKDIFRFFLCKKMPYFEEKQGSFLSVYTLRNEVGFFPMHGKLLFSQVSETGLSVAWLIQIGLTRLVW